MDLWLLFVLFLHSALFELSDLESEWFLFAVSVESFRALVGLSGVAMVGMTGVD